MPSYEEVLDSISETDYIHDHIQFIIDDNLRTISVPPLGVIAGVVGDKDTNYINFKMSRYYNGIDMSEFDPAIYYENANGRIDKYIVTDLTVEDDIMLFTWLVGEDVTAYPGNVRFSVNLSKKENDVVVKNFNTTFDTVRVLENVNYENYETSESIRKRDKSEFGNLVCFTDSIGQGQNNNDYSYINILEESGRFNSVTKAAVGSATFGKYTGISSDPVLKWAEGSSFYEQVRKDDYKQPLIDADNIIVQYMANDVLAVLGGYAQIGTSDDTGTTTMCGMIRNSLEYIRTLNPDAIITWISLFSTSEKLKVYATAYTGVSDKYSLGYTYDDIYNTAKSINDAAKKIFDKYNCNIMPILEGKPVNDYNVSSFFSSDNVHPNTVGHTLIAKQYLKVVRGGQEISWNELNAKLNSIQTGSSSETTVIQESKTKVFNMIVNSDTLTDGTTDITLSELISLHKQGYVIRGVCNLFGIDLIFNVVSVYESANYITLSTNAVTMGSGGTKQIIFTAEIYQDNKFNGVKAFNITGLSTSVTELAASIQGS